MFADPSSWIEDESGLYASLRPSFTLFDTNLDSGSSDRLRYAVQQAQVGGILVRRDVYFHYIAEIYSRLEICNGKQRSEGPARVGDARTSSYD